MQRLLGAAVGFLLVSVGAIADQQVTTMPPAVIPLANTRSAVYVDQNAVDVQINGDFATAFGLNVSGANTIRGNFTGSTGNDSANAVPPCPDTGGNHLNYTSGSGLSCGTSAVVYASNSAQPADPTGTTSASLVMMGLGRAASAMVITPLVSGKVKIDLNVGYTINASGIPVTVEVAYGTGSAPAYNDGFTGTLCGKPQSINIPTGNAIVVPLDCFPLVLTPNTQYWFDVAVQSNGTATVALSNIQFGAEEHP